MPTENAMREMRNVETARHDFDAAPRILAVWVDPRVQNDGVFVQDHPENRNDENYGARLLRQKLIAKGWRVHTQDVLQQKGITPDAVLFFDIPRKPVAGLLGPWAGKTRLLSFAIESPMVKPFVWDVKRHTPFETIFTWHTELLKQDRYVPMCLGVRIDSPLILKRDLSAKEKLCVMVAGNLVARVRSPFDLYKQRLAIARWYQHHHPEDFDLYGAGWDSARIRHSWRLQRMGLMGLINKVVGVEKHPCWRGTVEEKIPLLERYRFNIAFENARDVPGYVSERIFHAFLGSCIPVYWGAPDITDFVPADCFIDFRDYMSFPALHARLTSMSDEEYLGYIDRIEAFLHGPAAQQFRWVHITETIVRHVTGDWGGPARQDRLMPDADIA